MSFPLFHKIFLFLLATLTLSGCQQSFVNLQKNIPAKTQEINEIYQYLPTHPLVESAKKQIGVVIKYDTSYYQGGYPPSDRGACTDVIAQALKDNGYDLKAKIDEDMQKYPERYPHVSDPNINFRRVQNVKIFLDYYTKSLPTCITSDCFNQNDWQPGDIVTFDQIPGSLWHIAIISNKIKKGLNNNSLVTPLLIHNYGHGVVEDDLLFTWPAPITGHYRINF